MSEKTLSVEEAAEAMERWVRIRSRHYDYGPTPADVGHSALLRWLLDGNEAFVEPPPRMMSYPRYDLAAGEEVRPYGVWFPDGDEPIPVDGDVVIEQSPWDILEEHDDGSYTIRWCENDHATYLLAPLDEDEKTEFYQWSLKRVDDAEG